MTDKPRAPRKSRKSLMPTYTGRPVAFDQTQANKVCDALAAGETLTEICKREGMPKPNLVRTWAGTNPLFALQYNRARVEQTRAWSDQIVTLADDGAADYKEVQKRHGTQLVYDRQHVDRVRLRIETRKWIMAKINKAEYGEGAQNADGTPALSDQSPREMVGQLVHLLAQFEIHLTPEQVIAVQKAVTATDDEARLGR